MTTDTPAPTAASPDASESTRQGPGRLIRLARERARLGLPELAGLTKLAPATLEALERDDFSVLNEPVYVRGYYRKCAKALSISEQELLAAYEKMVAPRTPQAPTKLLLGGSNTGSGLKKGRRRAAPPWWLWLVGLGALVGIAAFVLRENPGESRGEPRPAQGAPATAPSAPAAAPAAPNTPPAGVTRPLSTNELSTTPADAGLSQPPAGPAAETPPVAAAPPAASAPAAHSAPAASAPAAGSAATVPAPASGDALALEFKATSWVRVEDDNGKVLLSGVIQQGDRQTVSGKPPYSLFLGNAPGVAVSYRGKAVDLGPYTRAKDNTARLSVPEDN
ncbi:MAG: helix-turn-helix domain-containing protein [Nevskia sp.]|nr:helix-turn-helix domain-containing protein [Nevskia sp.]